MSDLEQRKDETTDQYIDRLRTAAERADKLERTLELVKQSRAAAAQRHLDAHAALLAAQQERDHWKWDHQEASKELERRAEQAEAALLAAQQERDSLRLERDAALHNWEKDNAYLAVEADFRCKDDLERAEATITRIRRLCDSSITGMVAVSALRAAALAQDAEQAPPKPAKPAYPTYTERGDTPWRDAEQGERVSDRPLHDFIDMEAYDVVSGDVYRELRATNTRLREALEAIANGKDTVNSVGFRAGEAGVRQIARAALAQDAEQEKAPKVWIDGSPA